MQIAIDGPASSGKSTVAKLLAKNLGYIYCDTGAMYRAVTLLVLRNKVSLNDENKIIKLIKNSKINFNYKDDEQIICLNHENITEEIRHSYVTKNVSQVSSLPGVRKELVLRQQKIAKNKDIVMDGRDIGTTVLPNAQVKIYLFASIDERAKRRYLENMQKNINIPLDVLKKNIINRDYKDSHRKVSPLKKANNAVELDTTDLTINEVIDKIIEIVNNTYIN